MVSGWCVCVCVSVCVGVCVCVGLFCMCGCVLFSLRVIMEFCLLASSMPTSALDRSGSLITPCSRFCDAQRMSTQT